MEDKLLRKYRKTIRGMYTKDKHNEYKKIKYTIKNYIRNNLEYTNKEYISIEIERIKMIMENKKAPYLSILYAMLFALLPNLISICIDLNNKINDKTVFEVALSQSQSKIFQITSKNSAWIATEWFKIIMILYILGVIIYFLYDLRKREKSFQCYSIYLDTLKEVLKGDDILDNNIDDQVIEDYFKKEFYKRYKNKIIIAILIVLILVAPFIIQYGVINNNFISKATNDGWALFWGSYLGGLFGGIGTLIALYITVKQTREIQDENKDIQERIIGLEEKNKLTQSRTFLQEIMLMSDINLNSYKKIIHNSKFILTKEFQYLEKILNKELEYFELSTKIVNKKTRFVNINELDENIIHYCNFERYLFRAITNIGYNHMYNVEIHMEGEWFQVHNKIIHKGIFEASIDYIEEKGTVVLPTFKLDDDLYLWQFTPQKVLIKYYTGLIGERELITYEINYDMKNENIERDIKIEKVEENLKKLSSKFLTYRYIQ